MSPDPQRPVSPDPQRPVSPDPQRPVSPRLPAHQLGVRSAVQDGLACGPPVKGAGVERLRAALVAGMAPVAGTLPPGAEVCIDRHSLVRALACPASCVSRPFVWTASFAARTLGVPALRAMSEASGLGAPEAVGHAIEEAIAADRSVGRWLAGQDGPARGATVAAVATWVSRAWVAVPWGTLGSVRFKEDSIWVRPFGRAGPVVLKGRPEAAIVPPGRRPDAQVLLRMAPNHPATVRLDALAFTISCGFAPLRVVSVEAASGRVDSVDVDTALLQGALDDAVTAAAGLAPRAGAAPAAEVPGRQCWQCGRRVDCDAGTSWVSARQRRVGGIAVQVDT